MFQPSDPTPSPVPVQQSNSMNSPTISLTNKSISPPNVFPVVSRYAAGNINIILSNNRRRKSVM